jgi:hypothetical protein
LTDTTKLFKSPNGENIFIFIFSLNKAYWRAGYRIAEEGEAEICDKAYFTRQLMSEMVCYHIIPIKARS